MMMDEAFAIIGQKSPCFSHLLKAISLWYELSCIPTAGYIQQSDMICEDGLQLLSH